MMTTEIAELENALDELLFDDRPEGPAGKDLLSAAIAWSEAVWKRGESLGAIPLFQQDLDAAFRLSRNAVFICGVHRSGTTLLRDMLDGHPALAVLPSEGSYLTNLEPRMRNMTKGKRQAFMGMEWVRRFANPINQPPYWLLGRSTAEGSPYVLFIRWFITWWTIKDKRFTGDPLRPLLTTVLAYAFSKGNVTASHWVDKTPTNERYLKTLWKELPEARIIQIIRDPAAVFLSRKRMEKTLKFSGFIRDLELSFRVAYKQSLDKNKRYLLLRYEELCADPAAAAKKIAEFLEIEQTPSLLCPTVAGRPSKANSSFNRKSPEGRILSKDEHSHDDLLTTREHELLAAHIGSLAEKLGYPSKSVSPWKAYFLRFKSQVLL